MLKVGDKVRVREDLEKLTTFVTVREEMARLKGREVEISCVKVNWLDGIVSYGVKEDLGDWCWTEEMFEKIEEKESDNMKELTFREVIANIKEDEIWEGREYTITFLWKRIAIIHNDGDEYSGVYPLIEDTFKLKRPQYTFQEAFKAFEEGKEIESCESGFKFKIYEDKVRIKRVCYKVLYECLKVKIFSIEEILGGWYIND